MMDRVRLPVSVMNKSVHQDVQIKSELQKNQLLNFTYTYIPNLALGARQLEGVLKSLTCFYLSLGSLRLSAL